MLDANKDMNKNMLVKERSEGMRSMSYTKTNKLITALYMVTDIIDKQEPIRNKLRTLGTEIISDMYTSPSAACAKIAEVLSFLEISSAINIISEMNYSILRKEFTALDQAIKDSLNEGGAGNTEVNLSEFLSGELPVSPRLGGPAPKRFQVLHKYSSIGHRSSATRIGVQRGSTLMKALSDRILNSPIGRELSDSSNVKRERRDIILKIIKTLNGSATIKDIKDKINSGTEGAATYGEKTIQRELMSMIKDGVLNKTGEKRWSRYLIRV